MDGLDPLIADHNRVRGLFARSREVHKNDDTPAMGELADRIFEELEVHTEELAEVVNEGVQEHHVVDVLIEEARTLKPGDAEWVAKVTVLMENVEHHAEEEETELFPQVRSSTDAATHKERGTRFEARKAERGAPTPAQAAALTTKELRQRASQQQIPGRSTITRDDLVATIDPR